MQILEYGEISNVQMAHSLLKFLADGRKPSANLK